MRPTHPITAITCRKMKTSTGTHLVICQFEPADCTRLQKFLHDWLPLCGASHAASSTDNATNCPHCQREQETFWHFFKCQHPECNAHFTKLQADLNQLHIQHNVDPHLTQLFWQGLSATQQDTIIDDQLEAYPAPIQHLFCAQHDISWEQLPQFWTYAPLW